MILEWDEFKDLANKRNENVSYKSETFWLRGNFREWKSRKIQMPGIKVPMDSPYIDKEVPLTKDIIEESLKRAIEYVKDFRNCDGDIAYKIEFDPTMVGKALYTSYSDLAEEEAFTNGWKVSIMENISPNSGSSDIVYYFGKITENMEDCTYGCNSINIAYGSSKYSAKILKPKKAALKKDITITDMMGIVFKVGDTVVMPNHSSGYLGLDIGKVVGEKDEKVQVDLGYKKKSLDPDICLIIKSVDGRPLKF